MAGSGPRRVPGRGSDRAAVMYPVPWSARLTVGARSASAYGAPAPPVGDGVRGADDSGAFARTLAGASGPGLRPGGIT